MAYLTLQLVIFSDLDGCLLDKATYSFAPALDTLTRLKQLRIPVVLASSKTEAEMVPHAREMNLADAPLICENGGTIRWSSHNRDRVERTVLGANRSFITQTLAGLKGEFSFRSFTDLGVSGVAQCTGLSEAKARLATQRGSTEPLLWDDAIERIDAFRAAVVSAGLTLTRGGRFWHIAGETTKGRAMQEVFARLYTPEQKTIAIGDSPIDQSMLDVADFPIGIPNPSGEMQVNVHSGGRLANIPGPAGWAAEVGAIINQYS